MFKRSKFGAKKVVVDCIKFDSKRESERYLELKMLEKHGRIMGLCLQVPFTLQEAYRNGAGKKIREIKYIADFVYSMPFVEKDGDGDSVEWRTVVEDSKGFRTTDYKLKLKLFEKVFYPLTITETK